MLSPAPGVLICGERMGFIDRLCKDCGLAKPLSHFRVERGCHRYQCNSCRSEYRRREYATRKELRIKNRETCAARRVKLHETGITLARMDELKKRFGLTPEQYQAMWQEQNGQCRICGSPLIPGKGGHAIDHCHNSGRVRGLLCNGCNSGLGYFRDDPERMLRAIAYLKGG